ncbi:hypothetical protein H5410_034669 [Solanum commersonii]|uniref:Uncharacterized protein n=1 Tax=Solanum commersonii TaxID=4109 RepID=A0A9J5YRA4_SOLCO|nr:hypothetical protein H5410_034669 [Solanum commersonii]
MMIISYWLADTSTLLVLLEHTSEAGVLLNNNVPAVTLATLFHRMTQASRLSRPGILNETANTLTNAATQEFRVLTGNMIVADKLQTGERPESRCANKHMPTLECL